MSARGAFFGITGGVQRQHLVRAVLEAIAFQVQEVVLAVAACMPEGVKQLKVDGGACDNNFLMQLQADILGIPIERPVMRDVTAQGAGFAAGLAIGFWDSYAAIVHRRPIDRIFEPGSGRDRALEDFHIWQKAVERAKGWVD
jgi:glycerol kinase